ncbi:hypothetical protein ACWCPX_42570 [Streptomyces olivaceoviridis]
MPPFMRLCHRSGECSAPLLVDLPWPAENTAPPADPDLTGENPKELGITLTPQAE